VIQAVAFIDNALCNIQYPKLYDFDRASYVSHGAPCSDGRPRVVALAWLSLHLQINQCRNRLHSAHQQQQQRTRGPRCPHLRHETGAPQLSRATFSTANKLPPLGALQMLSHFSQLHACKQSLQMGWIRPGPSVCVLYMARFSILPAYMHAYIYTILGCVLGGQENLFQH
jgi:hypothetical protein